MPNKQIVYLSLLAVVLIVNAMLIVYTMRRPFAEHFSQRDEVEQEDTSALKSYIFKAFDERHQRNPTPEEVDKYMALKDKNVIKSTMDDEIKKPIIIDETTTSATSATSATSVAKVIDEQKPTEKEKSGIFNQALKNTLQLIDAAGGNKKDQEPIDETGDVTFSKTFIQTKIGNIQRQLDDLKRLL